MKNTCSWPISAIAILVFVALVESCSQINFESTVSKKSSFRVDEDLAFMISIENTGLWKKRVKFPLYGSQLFYYIKESEDTLWQEILLPVIDRSARNFTLNPRLPLELEGELYPNIMLLPDKVHMLKIIYYPRKSKKKYYDPNSKAKYSNIIFKETVLNFKTSSLPENGLEEWRWLDEHGLMSLYLDGTSGYVDNKIFATIEKFIATYPKSIFVARVKKMYIRHIVFTVNVGNASEDHIEKAIKYIREVGMDDQNAKRYLKILMEAKD